MYTNPLNPSIPIELTDHHAFLDNYQGPCGNCTFQSWNDDPEIDRTTIPRINDEQLIIEEKYSGVDGCFGTVRFIDYLLLIRFLSLLLLLVTCQSQ